MIKNDVNRSKSILSSYPKSMKIQTEKSEDLSKSKELKKTQDRLSVIQEQIERGEYKLDMKKTSEKMALNLLNL